MCVCIFACMLVHAPGECSAHGGQKVLGPLELELQVKGCSVGLRPEPGPPQEQQICLAAEPFSQFSQPQRWLSFVFCRLA